MNVCLYGASSSQIDESYIHAAEELGRKMAERGDALIFGGGATGLMGAAVRGIKKSGGYATGIAPDFFDRPGVLYRECDELIFTKTMRQRKQLMEDKADAFVMVPGGIGTFEEFFEVLTLKQLGRHTKPLAVFNVNGYYGHFSAMMANAVKEGFMQAGLELYGIFADPDTLLDYLEAAVARP